MTVSQRARVRSMVRRARPAQRFSGGPQPTALIGRMRPMTSPGQIAVLYRWGAWLLALGLIVTGSTSVYGANWVKNGDVFLLLGVTAAVNLLLTFGLRPYMRLMRRYPIVLVLDVLFCLGVYNRSNIWTSPFQFYSYAALMLPVAIFFFTGALAGSLLFLVLNLALLYGAGDTFAWARANGNADTYLMQLAIVPLLAFVFAYPNRLYAQLRRAQQRLDVVEREQLIATERTRIAQSLHDSVAQMLFGIRMLTESALARLSEHDTATGVPVGGTLVEGDRALEDRAPLASVLRQVRDLATKGNHEMRRAIYSLNEPGPSRRGLVVSLEAMLVDVHGRTGIDTHLATPGLGLEQADASDASDGEPGPSVEDPVRDDDASASSSRGDALPDPVALALYRVAREAMANVEKHAEALNVWVELRLEPSAGAGPSRQAVLTVRDDGRGFRRPLLAQPGEPDEDELGVMHFGLGNMRRAAESAGGRLDVTTGLGRGTTVVASVPLP